MNLLSRFYPESRFGGFSRVDGTVTFYNRVNALINPGSVVVDVGCGRGAYADDPVPYRRSLRILKGKCAKVVGIDVDRNSSENPFLDEFRLIQEERWPMDSGSVDLCLIDNVLEHVEDTSHFFQECSRVLKPRGFVCIRTPNLLSYVGLISKIVPNRQHVTFLKKVKDKMLEEDVFPTFYKCNTIRQLRRTLARYGFDVCVYGYESEPTYLAFSSFAYSIGVLLAQFTPNMFRIGIHAFGQKSPSDR